MVLGRLTSCPVPGWPRQAKATETASLNIGLTVIQFRRFDRRRSGITECTIYPQMVLNVIRLAEMSNSELAEVMVHESFHASGTGIDRGSDPEHGGWFTSPNDLAPELPRSMIQENCSDSRQVRGALCD